MIHDHQVVVLTPLRGNSKSIKDKNLKLLGGKPLLAWPLELAMSIPEIDRVLVSTDSTKIAEIAKDYGAEVYLRPDYLATDAALVIDVIRHLYQQLKNKTKAPMIMILLEATSPFRSKHLVQECLQQLVDDKLDSIATFSKAEINPHRCWRITNNIPEPFISDSIPWVPRQQLPPAYQLNGAVYAFYPDKLPIDSPSLLFGKAGAYIMQQQTIDIDTEKDFIFANALLKTNKFSEFV